MKYPILFFCLLGLWGCSTDPTEEANTGNIAGSVSDQTTGEPVATVSVTLAPSGKSTVTGSDGSFSFVDLAPGAYTVDISKEGYNPNSHTVGVVAGRTTEAHLTIERIPSIVTADREELDFGENASDNTRSFAIVNRSYEDLSWQIDCDCPWIKEIRPASGVLKWGKTETISVIIDRDILQDGNNQTVLVVRSTNGGYEVTVKVFGVAKKIATLNTLDVLSVAASSAVLNGKIVNAGYPEYTERGFVYSEQQMPTVDQTIQRITVPITEDKEFSAWVLGLNLGKTYYIRAYAVNPIGIAYSSNQVSFTTVAVAPSISVTKVDNIDKTAHTAIAHGSIASTGDPSYSERGFVYSDINSIPTIYNKSIIVEGTGIGSYDGMLSDLAVETTYYVRAYAKNEAGIAYSNNVFTFSTEEELPQVATLEPTDTDNTTFSVTLRGQIISTGDPAYTERGFVYSTEFNTPTIDDTKLLADGFGPGVFEIRANNFPSGKISYVRAYATNHKGTAYGRTIELFAPEWIDLPAAGIAVHRKDIGSGYWDSINAMCENSVVAGKTDWRLPTKEELMVLYNERNYIGGFTTISSTLSYYWSSTLDRETDGWARDYYFCIHFSNGNIDSGGSDWSKYNGRCVRTLK